MNEGRDLFPSIMGVIYYTKKEKSAIRKLILGYP